VPFSTLSEFTQNILHYQYHWKGPTISALVDTLEEAVSSDPQSFLSILPVFHEAKRPYQYGVINGFKKLWDAPLENHALDFWAHAWPELITFFDKLIGSPEFWSEQVIQYQDLTPNRDWIPPLIADFLRAGTHDDTKAYASELLPRTWSLIQTLLEKAEAESDPKEDAMFQAINSPKGKAIEALFSHALRCCRVADKQDGTHKRAWSEMKSAFEHELAKCKDANYEFSTLAGAYLANLDYLNHEWLESHFTEIFSIDYPANFACALEGLAYAPATKRVYALLLKNKVIDKALRSEAKGPHARENLLERIALAYLWGDEELNSPRFDYLFGSNLIDDLEVISRFFWSVRDHKLRPEQVRRILDFWVQCISQPQIVSDASERLLSSLSLLICYLEAIGEKEKKWLLTVAPYVVRGHGEHFFVNELVRLVDFSPAEVCTVFGKLLENYTPSFDFEDKLKTLLQKLARLGRREDAIVFADKLRHLSGIAELYADLARPR